MRDQPLARFAPGCILAGSKDDVSPQRESPGIDRCGEPRRRVIGMDVHSAEIVTEPRFHRTANRPGQWLAATLQCVDLIFEFMRKLRDLPRLLLRLYCPLIL